MKTKPPPKKISEIDSAKPHGFALVEMTIASSILLLMVFAIFEGGIMLYDKGLVSSASRDAARAVIVLRSPALNQAQLMQLAQNVVTNSYAQNFIGFGGPQSPATSVVGPVIDSVGTKQSVTVTYNYQGLVLPTLMSLVAPKNSISLGIPIASSTTMYME
mgnify:CR=1 FL=1